MAAHFALPPHSAVPPHTGRRAVGPPARPPAAEELASMGVAVGAIWAAVLAISLLAPDMVTGSEQQHMPVAAFGTWLWGVAGTWAALGTLASLRRSSRRHLHQPLALGVAALWAVAAAVAVFAPVVETGSDPTRLPLAAMVAPVVATVLTGLVRAAVDYVGSLFDEPLDVPFEAPDDELDDHGAVGFPA